ncbi:hypothetical protein SBRCBS47491_005579 [Sporothrix bragantina]|uniref:Uncharacterized protein n=1 Tax=Sporothrix bragantina TaxID=671064 RepID=A0ABP0BZM5_9PEZI
MDGGQSADLLPNYYTILNVNVSGSIHDVPTAFYRLVDKLVDKSQTKIEGGYNLLHDAYDCLSDVIDRTSYNEFYFNTPCWYSKPLWIAYRNERRRLQEKQLRTDREARESASMGFVHVAMSPPAVFHEIDTFKISETVNTFDAVDENGIAEITSSTCVDKTFNVDTMTVDDTNKDFEDIEAAIPTESQLTTTLEHVFTDVPVKKKKARTRQGGTRDRKAKKKRDAEEVAKRSKMGEKEKTVNGSTDGSHHDDVDVTNNDISFNTTQKTVKTLAHSRWANPQRCSDGLPGHPYENWKVKPDFTRCMVCSVWHYGSTFRCGKCNTLFCKHCYAKTTALRRRSAGVTA